MELPGVFNSQAKVPFGGMEGVGRAELNAGGVEQAWKWVGPAMAFTAKSYPYGGQTI